MRYRIVPGEEVTFDSEPWSLSGACPDGVKLVDPSARKVYSQGVGLTRSMQRAVPDCFGPKTPRSAAPDKPLYLFAYYGPLPAHVTTVTLRIQGFKETPVPVGR